MWQPPLLRKCCVQFVTCHSSCWLAMLPTKGFHQQCLEQKRPKRVAGRRGFVTILKKWTLCHNCKGTKRTVGPSAGNSYSPLYNHQVTSFLGPSSPNCSCSCSKAGELRWINAHLQFKQNITLPRHSGPNSILVWHRWSYIRLHFDPDIYIGFYSNKTFPFLLKEGWCNESGQRRLSTGWKPWSQLGVLPAQGQGLAGYGNHGVVTMYSRHCITFGLIYCECYSKLRI